MQDLRPIPTRTMDDGNEIDPVVGEDPRRSPDICPPAAEETPDRKNEGRNFGCLTLFLIAMPLLDTFGMLMSCARPYSHVILVLGLGGFACGTALGVYVSIKMQRPWWASCRWAIYGLLGMSLPMYIFFVLYWQWR